MDHADTLRLTRADLETTARLDGAPPIVRGSMTPRPWMNFRESVVQGLVQRVDDWLDDKPADALQHEKSSWQRAAAVRRNVLLALVLLTACGAAVLLTQAHPMFNHPVLRVFEIALFALLFAWVAAGFFTAMMGFYVHVFGDKHALSLSSLNQQPLQADARTAIIMPICNEQVSTVFAGLRATCESLAGTDSANLFDVYILSDTSKPDIRAAEQEAWAALRETLGEGTRVYYRWRRVRSRRKAGNVADFCRRWGKSYRYMVVLDADSVMTGDCLVSLTRLMEAHPKAGIIQTAPKTCGLETLHARVQQFAGRVTGRLFTTGMQYWQLGDSHYWGHNAIIRVEAFMKHCALAALPEKNGGHSHILSHDFVEAALMGRAGYETWLVPELAGSYEQQPPNLLEELQRDRRWCEGNLQNARLIAEPGLRGVHRAMLATGAMSYLSAPLWLAYLLLGTGAALLDNSVSVHQQGVPAAMVGLWACTAVLLFLPRVLGVAAILLRREQRLYGGITALVGGAVLEAALSLLQAPVRMVAHSTFVISGLTGLALEWKSPSREALSVDWSAAARRFGTLALPLGLLFIGLGILRPGAAIWLLPVALPLLLAIPLAVLTSEEPLGSAIRGRGLLLIPEEIFPPKVLRQAWAYAQRQVVPHLVVNPGRVIAGPATQPVPATLRQAS